MTERIQVTLQEAKSQFDKLAERAWLGDSVVILKDGKPYLDLVPHAEMVRQRKPGRFRGKIRMSADFDKALQDIASFEGVL
ncbi:type II toxin-antitoxin system Phd/YefM family antitoxin [Pseudomonas sp. GB2N2]